MGAASPPEQAWPALIRSQAPTLAITRPSLQQPAIADCFAPVGAADTGNVPRKNKVAFGCSEFMTEWERDKTLILSCGSVAVIAQLKQFWPPVFSNSQPQ